jgi:signal transduction histidine kinase
MRTAEHPVTRQPAHREQRQAFTRTESGERSVIALELQAMEDLHRLTTRLIAAADQQATLENAEGRKSELNALLAHELPIMERQLEHMARLFDDLADIALITDNRMQLERTRVMLDDLVSTSIENARPALEAAEHELEINLPAEPVVLDADFARMAQALGTLITNSAKCCPGQGLISIVASLDEGEVTIAVRDNAIGHGADAPRSVFGIFSQADPGIEGPSGGLMIGLALVKGLVEMHGGTVMAESEGPGRGTTFTVRLPAPGA